MHQIAQKFLNSELPALISLIGHLWLDKGLWAMIRVLQVPLLIATWHGFLWRNDDIKG
jgi:hypothetical protein